MQSKLKQKKRLIILIIVIIFFLIVSFLGYRAYLASQAKENARIQEEKRIENYNFTMDVVRFINEIHGAEEFVEFMPIKTSDDYKPAYFIREKYDNARKYIEKWEDTDDKTKKTAILEMESTLDDLDSFVNSWLNAVNNQKMSELDLAVVKLKAARKGVGLITGPIVLGEEPLSFTVEQKEKIRDFVLSFDWVVEAEKEKNEYLKENDSLSEFTGNSFFFPLLVLTNLM